MILILKLVSLILLSLVHLTDLVPLYYNISYAVFTLLMYDYISIVTLPVIRGLSIAF